MVRYQARSCPKCHYYLGYAIESSPIQSEAVLTSFCLNCTYQLPVRAVVRCIKTTTACTPASKPEVLLLQDAEAPSRDARSPVMSSAAVQAPEPAVARATYARDLRAIGQSLEKLEFTTFNLKRSGRSYFVWSTEPASPAQESHHPGSRSELNVRGSATVGSAVPTWLDRFAGSRYNPCDIARLENEGRQNRRRGFTHDHRLSRLLRTIGEHLARRNEQMLAIAWQKQQIGVVTRNLKGRLEMNLFRPEALYDLAAQMHLQRF